MRFLSALCIAMTTITITAPTHQSIFLAVDILAFTSKCKLLRTCIFLYKASHLWSQINRIYGDYDKLNGQHLHNRTVNVCSAWTSFRLRSASVYSLCFYRLLYLPKFQMNIFPLNLISQMTDLWNFPSFRIFFFPSNFINDIK